MTTKGLIPLSLEPGEVYHVQGTEFDGWKFTTRAGMTREFKVTLTNGAVLYIPLPSQTVLYEGESETGYVTAGPLTS
jgi:hypothetical protein